jgi:uncharacterized repeat protein (TIGR03803 family)
MDAAGNLYGSAPQGGANADGTLWELASGSGTITALASFDTNSGTNPNGVTIGANGRLYGTTALGGANDDGTVWEFQGASVPEPSSIVTGLIGLALA